MKVFIIGANGQVGKRLVRELKESDDFSPIAMVRNTSQFEEFIQAGIPSVLGDLEDSMGSLSSLMKDSKAEAVVFTAGSGGSTGADKTMLIDLDGAIKAIKAAEEANIKRFIMISAVGVNKWHDKNPPEWVLQGSYYSAAKYYADTFLENSQLDYTIIRPGHLINESGTGKVRIGDHLDHQNISRDDVAKVILSALRNKNTIHQSFDVINGSVPIEYEIEKLIPNI